MIAQQLPSPTFAIVMSIYQIIIFKSIILANPMVLCCSEDDREETFPASRVISSQIYGYDGGKVDAKERVEGIFPVNVRMC